MNKISYLLIFINATLLALNIFLFGKEKVNDSKIQKEIVKIESPVIDEKNNASSQNKSNKRKMSDREKRLSARFFIPESGQRNAFTDMMDGMVLQQLERMQNSSLAESYRALLIEENGEEDKGKLNEKVEKFKGIVTAYLSKVYQMRRGMEKEINLDEQQMVMLNSLSQELGLSGGRLARLREIEVKSKVERQLSGYEKFLIRDADKLSETQKTSLGEILEKSQVTILDKAPDLDETLKRSDELLEKIGGVLNGDQKTYFRHYQEYYWNSYDISEINDLKIF